MVDDSPSRAATKRRRTFREEKQCHSRIRQAECACWPNGRRSRRDRDRRAGGAGRDALQIGARGTALRTLGEIEIMETISLEVLRRAIETRDGAALGGCYADDAVLLIIDQLNPPN